MLEPPLAVIAAEVWIVESGKTTPFNVDKGIC
jgi:hypothetical protein